MLCFPNAKINIGLHVVNRRADGYHDLETLFYPVNICDALETTDAPKTSLHTYGEAIPGDENNNLVLQAYNLLCNDFELAAQKFTLLKKIPTGAGLGGGSSDAAWAIKLLNDRFNLQLSLEKMEGYARVLGADCAFFIKNEPAFGSGRGDVFSDCPHLLSGKTIAIIKPPIHISTADAFSQIVPKFPDTPLSERVKLPVAEWKECITNDFEPVICKRYPELAAIKANLYQHGALFAQMSGTGSAFYGIFETSILIDVPKNYAVYYSRLP